MSSELEAAVEHVRPALLRHCYRMLGSWADAEDVLQDALERAWKSKESFRGDAPISRWLFTIATNACLTALKQRQRRSLPQLDLEPVRGDAAIGAMEADRFVTPAPDALLFPDPEALSTSRETVTLAFIALLQRVPPRQRAVLLLKDVLGWSAAEIAEAFDMSVAAVNSALHRSHAAVARPVPPSEAPSPTTLQRFVTAWETRDLDALVALLHHDVELAMPPYPMWFRGVDDVVRFLRSPRFSTFWAAGVHLIPTRANGEPAFAFHRRAADGTWARHSIMVARFVAEQVAELMVFVGAHHFSGFPTKVDPDRTVLGSAVVMEDGGRHP